MNSLVREYKPEDKQFCLKAFESNIPEFFVQDELIDFDNFLNRIATENINTKYYVVVHNNQIIGCGGFGDKDNKSVLSLTWGLIDKSYHKKGFGALLLKHRLDEAKRLFPELPMVLDTTQHSFGFFEKYGFKVTKITHDFYAQGMHRYDMELPTQSS